MLSAVGLIAILLCGKFSFLSEVGEDDLRLSRYNFIAVALPSNNFLKPFVLQLVVGINKRMLERGKQ